MKVDQGRYGRRPNQRRVSGEHDQVEDVLPDQRGRMARVVKIEVAAFGQQQVSGSVGSKTAVAVEVTEALERGEEVRPGDRDRDLRI